MFTWFKLVRKEALGTDCGTCTEQLFGVALLQPAHPSLCLGKVHAES